MIVLVHTSMSLDDMEMQMGRPEYSYRFVLREFRPVLDELGIVIEVKDPQHEVDTIYANCVRHDEACVFLCFMPPHKVPLGLACPTIPVFAWEYDALPDEAFGGKPRNDWVRVLKQLGAALTHSSFMADRVRARLGSEFPITSIPAPLWGCVHAMPYPKRETTRLHIAGLVIDSSRTDLSAYSRTRMEAAEPEILPLPANIGDYQGEISLGGVLYTSIFNPHDGRKNWSEMITAFCVAMRDREDATLLLKFTHYAPHDLIPDMLKTIYKMGRLACRILMIHSYLQQPEYDALLAATTYAVNTSHGEGQCLPLMEYMAAGIPAIAPRHTSMLDYIDADCAFVIDSSAELGTWPHDQRQAYRTLRQRIHFQSLVEAFQRSYHVARHEPETYAAMAAAAVESQKNYCSVAVVRSRLEQFMQERLANDAGGHTTPAPQQHA